MYTPGLYVLAVLHLSLLSAAQNFAIPTNWRVEYTFGPASSHLFTEGQKPTSSLDRHDRLSLVNGVLDTILPTFNSSSGLLNGLSLTQTASLLCAMSIGDLINSSTTSRNAVINSLNTVFKLSPNISTLWGLAAIDSYKAYNDQGSLAFAQSIWAQLQKFMIQPSQALAGIHPLKSVNFPPTCNQASIAGGVFYLTNSPDNTDVNGETVAAFMALSARLFEATSDTQYQTAAELSAQFIMDQLFNGAVILDTITISNCLTNDDIVTYNSGFTIEGLSVLASKNASWTPFLTSLVSTAIATTTWTNTSDGIIFEGPSSVSAANTDDFGTALKAILIRGLYEAWSRSPSGSAVADLIASYITVQFNALQDLASTSGSSQYSPRWEGPPTSQFLPWGQLAALDVLNSAVGISLNSSSPDSITSTASAQPGHSSSSSDASPTGRPQGPDNQGTHKSSHTAVLVGGIIAGLAVIALISVLIFVMLRRRHRRTKEEYAQNMMEETPIPYRSQPFAFSPTEGQATLSSPTNFPNSDGTSQSFYHTGDKNPSLTVLSYTPAQAPASRTTAPTSSAELSQIPSTAAESGEPPPTTSASSPSTQARPPTEDFDSVPALIDRLNRILSTLPLGGIDEEAPPRYDG